MFPQLETNFGIYSLSPVVHLVLVLEVEFRTPTARNVHSRPKDRQ